MQPERMQPIESRRTRIEKVFNDHGWDHVDLEQWEGDDLEELRSMLTEEQFQALLDELADEGEHEY